MVKKALVLGPKRFASLKDAWDGARGVRRYLHETAELGRPVPEEDMEWLEPLFRRHPAPGKLAGWDPRGGASVEVVHDEWRRRTFALRTAGGLLRTIGAKKCIFDGLPDGPNSAAVAAAAAEAARLADVAAWEVAAVAAIEEYERIAAKEEAAAAAAAAERVCAD